MEGSKACMSFLGFTLLFSSVTCFFPRYSRFGISPDYGNEERLWFPPGAPFTPHQYGWNFPRRDNPHRPSPSGSPSSGTSSPGLHIRRVFGLLDESDTTKPKLEKSISTPELTPDVHLDKRIGDVEKLVNLVPTVIQETNNQQLQKLAAIISFKDLIANLGLVTENIKGSVRFVPSQSGRITSCRKHIEIMLKALEQDHLGLRERVWILGILKGIQPNLSAEDGKLLRTNFQEGSLSRGELELLLNQNKNLAASAINLWEQDSEHVEIDPGILEAMERVELFLKLDEYFKTKEANRTSPDFITVYNTLLQARCPIPEEILSFLIKSCQHQMENEGVPEGEIISLYHIMTHLQEHYQEVIDHLADKKIINPIFESRYASLRKDFEYQGKVKEDVKAFFGREHGDLYMENLVAPFIGWSKVDLKHYDYVLTSLKAYEDEMRKLNPQDHQKTSVYMANKKEVIAILTKAADHIEGAQKLMDPERPTSANNKVESVSKHIPQGTNKGGQEMKACPICLQEFLHERVLRLNCHETHVYHEHCIKPHIDKCQDQGPEKPFCPMCRKVVQTPIPRRGHIFWNSPRSTPELEPPIAPSSKIVDME